jgi:hypothetical protein
MQFFRLVIGGSLLVLLLIVPLESQAVTSGNFLTCDGVDCSACNIADLANRVITWLVGILFMVFAVIATLAGFKLVTSGGNPSALSAAKESLVNAIVGLLILLAAWIIVDTLIRGLGVTGIDRQPFPWSQIQCQYQTAPTEGTRDTFGTGSGWGTSTANIGTGTPAIAAFAQQMQANNCIYDQARRNGCQTNPGYTDCSDLVNVAYRNAGCRSPGATTAQQVQSAGPVGDSASLRPGDTLVYNTGGAGHVVICQNAGCTSVIHASGTGRNIVVGNGSYYLNRADIRVNRASDYCN